MGAMKDHERQALVKDFDQHHLHFVQNKTQRPPVFRFLEGPQLRGGGVRPTAPGAYPGENWYPVVVEVVVGLFRRESNMPVMDDWRMDCPWWIVLWIIL